MRILILATIFSNGGGAERAVREWRTGLKALGHHVDVLVVKRHPSDPPDVKDVRYEWEKYVRYFTDLLGGMQDWRHFGSRQVLKHIHAGDYDVVHVHNPYAAWSFNAISRLASRIPTLWSAHDEFPLNLFAPYDLSRIMSPSEARSRWKNVDNLLLDHSHARRMARFLSERVHTIAGLVCHSEYVFNLAKQSSLWKDRPVWNVRYGVSMLDEPGRFMDRAQARKELNLSEQDRVVLLIANHLGNVVKGMDLAIDALKHVKTPGCKVLLVGRAGENLTAQLPQEVRALGYVSDSASLARAYRAADVMLFPSIAEAFGLVGAEAMACETPVTGFAVGGLNELVGDNERGLLAKLFDVEAMAANIDRLLTDTELNARLGTAARAWVEANCRPEDSVRNLLLIYEQLKSGKISGRSENDKQAIQRDRQAVI